MSKEVGTKVSGIAQVTQEQAAQLEQQRLLQEQFKRAQEQNAVDFSLNVAPTIAPVELEPEVEELQPQIVVPEQKPLYLSLTSTTPLLISAHKQQRKQHTNNSQILLPLRLLSSHKFRTLPLQSRTKQLIMVKNVRVQTKQSFWKRDNKLMV